MTNFNEHALEMSIMELFQDEEYTYINGESIIRRDLNLDALWETAYTNS